MKKLLVSFLMFIGAIAFAADDLTKYVMTVVPAVTTTNAPTQSYNGFLDSVFVDISGVTTGTVTLTSSRTGEMLFSAATSVDKVYRPRANVMATNGVTTNYTERIKLVEEPIIITMSTTSTGSTNSHNVYIKISEQ